MYNDEDKDNSVTITFNDSKFESIDWSTVFYNTASGANITAATANNFISPSFNNSYTITSANSNSNHGLEVNGDANFKGDIKWKGRSLDQTLKAIEDRLAILVPDPEKLEHFEALKKAYEHYKVLEALCSLPPKEEK
jgi:hypothetical protein